MYTNFKLWLFERQSVGIPTTLDGRALREDTAERLSLTEALAIMRSASLETRSLWDGEDWRLCHPVVGAVEVDLLKPPISERPGIYGPGTGRADWRLLPGLDIVREIELVQRRVLLEPGLVYALRGSPRCGLEQLLKDGGVWVRPDGGLIPLGRPPENPYQRR